MEEIKLIGTVNEFSVVIQQYITARLYAIDLLVQLVPDYNHPDLESVSLNIRNVKADEDHDWIVNWITVNKDEQSGEIILARMDANPNPIVDKAWEIIFKELRFHGLLEKQGWVIPDHRQLDKNNPERQGYNDKTYSISKREKRGRSKYSDKEKLDALEEWDELDPAISGVTLEEFLERKFGIERGFLNVQTSTFHTWRESLKKKGLYK